MIIVAVVVVIGAVVLVVLLVLLVGKVNAHFTVRFSFFHACFIVSGLFQDFLGGAAGLVLGCSSSSKMRVSGFVLGSIGKHRNLAFPDVRSFDRHSCY